MSAAAGDFNNDLSPDLVVLTDAAPRLFRNDKGRFTPVNVAWPAGKFSKAMWLDFDHDYDLDLFLFGDRSVLMRNSGAAGFEDKTASFPFRLGAVTAAAMTRLNPDSRAFDLRVDLAGGQHLVYRDRLSGVYEAAAETRIGLPSNSRLAEADFNLDGRLDRAEISDAGVARLGLDMNPQAPRWIRVALTGVRNLRVASDAFVEVKVGSLYKRARYDGLPLLFLVGNAAEVDVVRITWPNGLIQNETKLLTNRGHAFKEAQRRRAWPHPRRHEDRNLIQADETRRKNRIDQRRRAAADRHHWTWRQLSRRQHARLRRTYAGNAKARTVEDQQVKSARRILRRHRR